MKDVDVQTLEGAAELIAQIYDLPLEKVKEDVLAAYKQVDKEPEGLQLQGNKPQAL